MRIFVSELRNKHYLLLIVVATRQFSGTLCYFMSKKKSTQEQIYNFAKEVGAKWIVVESDHYRGNNKGYYQTVEQFKDSKVFQWNNKPEGRGAISVYVTDIDIPAAVKIRWDLECEMARLDASLLHFMNYASINFPVPRMDKRWGANNPKRLAVEKKMQERRNAIKGAQEKHDNKIAEIKSKLIDTNFVSSTYIQISI